MACFVGSLAPLGAFARLLAPQEALPTAWRRRPAPFAFEGIQPHLEPNRASGKVSAGAIRLGHFYVVADLFLRLHQYGPPFFPPTPLCRVCAAVASEVPLHHVPPLPSLCCGRVVAGQPPQGRDIDPTNLPDHGRVPEEVGGLQGSGKVFARRGGAR